MRRQKIIGSAMALVSAVLLATLWLIHLSWAQDWTEMPLDEGGVGQDVQIQRLADNSFGDVLWSANMESGVLRCVNNIGSPDYNWGAWEDFMRHIGFLGVDAIKIGANEHVLAASDHVGVYYRQNPTTTTDMWDYPITQYYPANWKKMRIHDAAFFYDPTSGYGTLPEEQYLVILAEDYNPTGQLNLGIYRWTGSSPYYFQRIDDLSTDPRGFEYFWRDLGNANVLYTVMNGGVGYNGSLCKISGSYSAPAFDAIAMTDVAEVKGFNQWKEGSTVYSYALVLKTNGDYEVWYNDNLANGNSFTYLCDVDAAYFDEDYGDDWQQIADAIGDNGHSQIMGRYYPDTTPYHKIWLSTGTDAQGIIFYNSSGGGWLGGPNL